MSGFPYKIVKSDGKQILEQSSCSGAYVEVDEEVKNQQKLVNNLLWEYNNTLERFQKEGYNLKTDLILQNLSLYLKYKIPYIENLKIIRIQAKKLFLSELEAIYFAYLIYSLSFEDFLEDIQKLQRQLEEKFIEEFQIYENPNPEYEKILLYYFLLMSTVKIFLNEQVYSDMIVAYLENQIPGINEILIKRQDQFSSILDSLGIKKMNKMFNYFTEQQKKIIKNENSGQIQLSEEFEQDFLNIKNSQKYDKNLDFNQVTQELILFKENEEISGEINLKENIVVEKSIQEIQKEMIEKNQDLQNQLIFLNSQIYDGNINNQLQDTGNFSRGLLISSLSSLKKRQVNKNYFSQSNQNFTSSSYKFLTNKSDNSQILSKNTNIDLFIDISQDDYLKRKSQYNEELNQQKKIKTENSFQKIQSNLIISDHIEESNSEIGQFLENNSQVYSQEQENLQFFQESPKKINYFGFNQIRNQNQNQNQNQQKTKDLQNKQKFNDDQKNQNIQEQVFTNQNNNDDQTIFQNQKLQNGTESQDLQKYQLSLDFQQNNLEKSMYFYKNDVQVNEQNSFIFQNNQLQNERNQDEQNIEKLISKEQSSQIMENKQFQQEKVNSQNFSSSGQLQKLNKPNYSSFFNIENLKNASSELNQAENQKIQSEKIQNYQNLEIQISGELMNSNKIEISQEVLEFQKFQIPQKFKDYINLNNNNDAQTQNINNNPQIQNQNNSHLSNSGWVITNSVAIEDLKSKKIDRHSQLLQGLIRNQEIKKEDDENNWIIYDSECFKVSEKNMKLNSQQIQDIYKNNQGQQQNFKNNIQLENHLQSQNQVPQQINSQITQNYQQQQQKFEPQNARNENQNQIHFQVQNQNQLKNIQQNQNLNILNQIPFININQNQKNEKQNSLILVNQEIQNQQSLTQNYNILFQETNQINKNQEQINQNQRFIKSNSLSEAKNNSQQNQDELFQISLLFEKSQDLQKKNIDDNISNLEIQKEYFISQNVNKFINPLNPFETTNQTE